MIRFYNGFLLLVLFAVGCTTSQGFNRGELRDELSHHMTVTDQDIKSALALKPQLPKPFKVGIYFKESDTSRYDKAKWRWTGEDKEKIVSLAQQLKDSKEVSDVFVISDAVINGTDLKSLRLAAAQHGADALMVLSAVNKLDSYENGLAWTYIALVPAFFVHGNQTDSLFMVRAALWDVRNEFLYMTADAESVKSQAKPCLFNDSKQIIDDSKAEALDKLRGEISKMMAGLSAKKVSQN